MQQLKQLDFDIMSWGSTEFSKNRSIIMVLYSNLLIMTRLIALRGGGFTPPTFIAIFTTGSTAQ
jgi:hypothetical protein